MLLVTKKYRRPRKKAEEEKKVEEAEQPGELHPGGTQLDRPRSPAVPPVARAPGGPASRPG